ncbi:MAG: hypothetical protein LBD33_02750 [Puniceicoccales bacterium]|jgi:hypothetical protein|nr:hypothetical protein [Puniceicoccales bacterium]
MKKNSNVKNEDDYLHELLQIKRLERPDKVRWARFDRAFEAKRLSAIADGNGTFVGRILEILTGKRLACTMASMCLVAIVAIGFERSSKCCSNHAASFVSDGAVKPSYVRDNIMCNVESVDFKTRISHDFRGVAYVCDAISNGGTFVR